MGAKIHAVKPLDFPLLVDENIGPDVVEGLRARGIGPYRRTPSIRNDKKMASTKDVLDHHIKCFGESDLMGILSDYASDAILFTPDGPLRGPDAIAPFFQAMLAEFGKPGITFSLTHQSVEGDYAYVLWTAETADNAYELGTDTLVVRGGKIVAQSFAGKITPKS